MRAMLLLSLRPGSRALHVCAGSCREPPLRASTTTTSAVAQQQHQPQRLEQLCMEYGIHLARGIHVKQGAWGLGLYRADPQHDSDSKHQQQLLVAVPLDLVLSCSIPGCSPAPHSTPSQLQALLAGSECSAAWELQVAALLLWAVREPTSTRVGGFWRRNAAHLLPGLQDNASLLVWSEQELQELQDAALQATAQAWQQQVASAFHAAVAPCFASLAAAQCSSSAVRQPVTLAEWQWAVATVESRAFGVTGQLSHSSAAAGTGAVDEAGSSSTPDAASASHAPVGLVPVLDLANHAFDSACYHGVDQSTGTFALSALPSARQQQQQQQQQQQAGGDGGRDTPLLISYGSKDSRQLMEQYGFVVPGNPLDRIPFCADLVRGQQHAGAWMSHAAVKAAGRAVAEQQQQRHEEHEQQQHHKQRVQAAVTSILRAGGWNNLQQWRAVTPHTTALCARALLAWVQAQLAACPTSAEADRGLLLRNGGCSNNARLAAAVRYRLERKELLLCAREILSRVLLMDGGGGGA